ncbi:hypothetical protein L9F63_000568, partial [Diploptera punctata]
ISWLVINMVDSGVLGLDAHWLHLVFPITLIISKPNLISSMNAVIINITVCVIGQFQILLNISLVSNSVPTVYYVTHCYFFPRR